ncbi:unnamed protein product, partial [Prorocentrum cordatum]
AALRGWPAARAPAVAGKEPAASSDEELEGSWSDDSSSVAASEKAAALAHFRAQTRGGCVELCCARLLCSWFCKLLVLLSLTAGIFAYGPLSRPMWIPISSYSRGCERNADGSDGAFEKRGSHSLNSCKGLCERTDGCVAVDVFNHTHACALYRQPCLFPQSTRDGAASFQIARFCSVPDGTRGILIEGECNTDIQPPTFWALASSELLHV